MSRWWRAYDEAVDDPKLILLNDRQHRAWFNLCCVTSQNGGVLPPVKMIAVKLRITPDKARDIVAQLVALGLVDNDGNGAFAPHNWGGRQFQSDVSTERVKRFRNGKRNVSETASETAPDTEADTDSETEGTETVEIPSVKTTRNLADAVGGRKTTRPSIDGFFDEFWRVYPKRGDASNPKKPARDKLERAIRAGADPAVIIAAAARYASIEGTAGRSNTEKIAQAVTWLNQQRWQDYPELAVGADGPPTPPDPSMPSDAELRARYAARLPDTKSEDASLLREGGSAHSGDEEAVRH